MVFVSFQVHISVYQLLTCMESAVLSEYVKQLSVEAKKRFTMKLAEISCAIDLYIGH